MKYVDFLLEDDVVDDGFIFFWYIFELDVSESVGVYEEKVFLGLGDLFRSVCDVIFWCVNCVVIGCKFCYWGDF